MYSEKNQKKIILFGLPNSGKTTLFNKLAKKYKQTSNYSGTTISENISEIKSPKGGTYQLVDLPGCTATSSIHVEENSAWEFLQKSSKNTQSIFIQVISPTEWKQAFLLTIKALSLGIKPVIFLNTKEELFQKNSENFITSIENIFGKIFVGDIFEKKFLEKFWDFFTGTFKNISTDRSLKKLYKLSVPAKLRFLQEHIIPPVEKTFQKISKKIDKTILHAFWGIPIFAIVMWVLFQLTFTVGQPFMDWIDSGSSFFYGYLSEKIPENFWGKSVLLDGIINGVSGMVIFLPNVFLLFLGLSLLQQSGYLARVAYLFDHLFRYIGINGKATVPLLMGFGCNVPSLMALKSFATKKEKIITAMMTVFMSCGARLPVLTMLIAAFIPVYFQGLVLWSVYAFGIFVAVITGLWMNKVLPKDKTVFCLSLPSYQNPDIKMALLFAIDKSKHFLQKILKIVLPMSIILWGLFHYPVEEVKISGISGSYGASIGKTIQPIFEPLGFDWRITTGILSGLAAKEVLVTTFSEIYVGDGEDNDSLMKRLRNDGIFSLPVAISLIVFVLLYTPCLAVIGVLKDELGWRWAVFGFFYPTLMAWIFSFLFYTILS